MINTILVKKTVKIALFSVIAYMASWVNMSSIVGTVYAFFSLKNGVAPLGGFFGGAPISIFIFLIGLIARGVSQSLFMILVYHIPGLCASLYWAQKGAFWRIIVPITCILAFIAHPVGSQAWLYTGYWLIPVALYLLKKDTLVAYAITSTFIAHAVGSTLFIYGNPMTAEVWLGLIPVVLLERAVYTGTMIITYVIIQQGAALCMSYVSYKKSKNIVGSNI